MKKTIANILIVLCALWVLGMCVQTVQSPSKPATRAEAYGEITGFFIPIVGLAASIGWRRRLSKP